MWTTDPSSHPAVCGGLDTLPVPGLIAVVRAVWFESGSMRHAIHRLRGVRACDLTLAVAGTRFGDGPMEPSGPAAMLLVSGECRCRDYLVDLLVAADRFLVEHGSALRNPPGAVRAHLRKREPADWTRRRRTELGAQARTDRIRRTARARHLQDDFHRALFEYIADEAGSLAPLEDDAQLLRRLAERAAQEFGGDPGEYTGRVASGLAVVEVACRAGRRVAAAPDRPKELITWFERFIERPMGKRDRLTEESLTVDAERSEADHAAELAEFDRLLDAHRCVETDDEVLGVVLEATSAAGSSPDRHDALIAAAADLVDRCALTAEVAASFVRDERRVQEAIDCIRDLVGAAA